MFSKKYLAFSGLVVSILLTASAMVPAYAGDPIARDYIPSPICHSVKHPKKWLKRHPNRVLFKGHLRCTFR